MKIIIIDDEMSALHTFLNDVIGQSDVEYKFFKDDEDEITAYIRKNRVAAAFLDICMPNIDGRTLARHLIDLCPEIKIVFITGLNVSASDLDPIVKEHTMGFLYKPYDTDALERYLAAISHGEQRLTAKMFGAFDCFVNDRKINFSSQKSKELFALLLTYNGKTLTMNDAISQLWPNLDTTKSKPLYRDAVWRLRKTLKETDFCCVEFGRAQMTLNKQNIDCDYWDYLEHRTMPRGEFLKSYEWSADYVTA